MPIVFSAVACDRKIVAEFASCDGNFTEIAEQVLSKLPPCNNKMTYSHGIYLLHYISEEDYLYFCITDKLCQRSRAFLFLNEIQRRYIANLQSKEDFITILAAEMYRYSEDYSTIVIRKGELDELNSIGVGCSESILGEKILYINNPDNVSYSTTSHMSVTPGLISVSLVSSTVEGLSAVSSISDIILVEDPIPERISAKSPTSEKVSAESPPSGRISVERPSLEEISAVSPEPMSISAVSLTPETTTSVSSNSEKVSDVDLITETIISVVSLVAQAPVKELDLSLAAERISASSPTPETILTLSQTPVGTSPVSPTPEETSSVSLTERTPVVSPKLYVVIMGMIMLVIAMSIYAFGPISCVVVTSIGIYSLLRFYVDSKHKTE